jgi:hypothetical protein
VAPFAQECVTQQMLETFTSVGAESFDLTITTCAGEKVEFRRGLALESLLRRLRGGLARCRVAALLLASVNPNQAAPSCILGAGP